MIAARRMRSPGVFAAAAAVTWLAGCGTSPLAPAVLDTRHEACSHCRMTVSDPTFAAQIVGPGEEPRFFDDVGCLKAYLEEGEPLTPGSAVFVGSHRSGSWVPAGDAVYLRNEAIQTPMGFHYVAFATAAERDADPAVRGGAPLSAADLFGTRLPKEPAP